MSTLLEFKQMLDESVMRTDLKHRYLGWINSSLRKIQQDREWRFFGQKVADVTMPAGESSVRLPDDFKELTREITPVAVKDDTSPDATAFPCEVISREQTLNYRSTTFFAPMAGTPRTARTGIPVFLTFDGDGEASLNIPREAVTNLVFVVSYSAFLPNLEDDADSNRLTREYEELCEARIKMRAFAYVNDNEQAAVQAALYTRLLAEAGADDFARRHSGRKFRFGG